MIRRRAAGQSLVEFALILPILLCLYFGAVEVGQALIINRKVTHATSTVTSVETRGTRRNPRSKRPRKAAM